MARTTDHARHEDVAWRAFEAIRARGVHGVSMSDVAADLGMKRSSLYWYFSGLDAIFEAVLERTLERLGASVAERLAERLADSDGEAEHPVRLVAAWMEAVIAFYDDDPQLIGVLAQFWALGSAHDAEKVLARTRTFLEPILAGAVDMLEQGVAAGQVEPCDAPALVDLCVATVDGLLVHQVSRGVAPRPALQVFVDAVLLPLERKPTTAPTARWSAEED